jgi:hypothetical protein
MQRDTQFTVYLADTFFEIGLSLADGISMDFRCAGQKVRAQAGWG